MLDRDDFETEKEYEEAMNIAIDRAEAMADEIKFEAFVRMQENQNK